MVLPILYAKRNPFFNINDTEYTHLTNDLKINPFCTDANYIAVHIFQLMGLVL